MRALMSGVQQQSTRVFALTGIRALFAASVFFFHSVGDHPLTRYGWMGVNGFFALSGYLFGYLYRDTVWDFGAIKDYALKRFIRIYPLYFAVVLVGAWLSQSTGADILVHLFAAHTLFSEYRTTLSSPLWTISTEAGFYVMFPFVSAFIRRLRLSSPTKLWPPVMGLLLMLLAVRELVGLFLHVKSDLTGQWDHSFWAMTAPGRFYDFAFGMIAALFVPSKWWARIWGLIGVAIFALVIVFIERQGGLGIAARHPYFGWIGMGIGLAFSCFLPAVHYDKGVDRVLGNKPMVFLGEISFGVYLLHELLLDHGPLRYAVRWLLPNKWQWAIVMYVVVSAIAALVYRFYEQPISGWLRSRLLPHAFGPRIKSEGQQ